MCHQLLLVLESNCGLIKTKQNISGVSINLLLSGIVDSNTEMQYIQRANLTARNHAT